MKKIIIFAWLVLLISIFVLLSCISGYGADKVSFVQVYGKNLVVNGRDFKFIGATAVNLVFYDDWDLDLDRALLDAKNNNLSVIRVYLDWGWGKSEDYDRILASASKYGIYVILTLTDCCRSCDYKNLEHYLKVRAPFCNVSERKSINAFKKRIKELISRKNSVNGRLYRDDQTIFAWELANELEYWHFSDFQVKNWIKELVNYIKSIDRNHLVTIGISTDNPEFDNSRKLYDLFNIPELDFYSLHFYPSGQVIEPGRLVFKNDFVQQIRSRINKFISLGKPVVLGEFGLSNSPRINNEFRSNQPEFYNSELKKIMDTSFSAGAAGVMFWGWGVPEEKGIPMWWSGESHSQTDNKFCEFVKRYKILPGR